MSGRKKVEVAAAVIRREDGCFLLGQRAPGTVYAGYWEFPGGKVESGETAREALVRELDEELGIQTEIANPWIVREYEYEHAHVRLHFFEVTHWRGEPKSHIHSALAWQQAGAIAVSPMLPANAPVLRALELPHRMAITHASEIGVDAQLIALEAALARGLKLVQLREGALAPSERLRFAHAARDITKAQGAILLVNGDADLARAIGADGLHLPAAQLKAARSRPDFDWVGASTHDAEELAQAAQLGLDYAVLGPVLETASHPGATGMGWARFASLMAGLPLPVFAIGGLTEKDMAAARAAGAHGIAAIRSNWG